VEPIYLPDDCVSVSYHYKNPTMHVGLVQSGPDLIEM